MMQYVIIAALIAFIYFFYIKKKPQKVNHHNSNKKSTLEADDMIECTQCGVYSQLSDSILSNGKYYCSDECVKEAK